MGLIWAYVIAAAMGNAGLHDMLQVPDGNGRFWSRFVLIAAIAMI
jgi:hypothetical protein